MIEGGKARVVTLALTISLSALGAADWPQFRGSDRDGISDETELLGPWPDAGPEVVWRRELGEGYSSVSVAGGRACTLYSAAQDEFVACFDAKSGEPLWKVRIDSKWVDRFGNGPRSTPTIDGDRLFALGAKGKLVALSSDKGELVWKRDLESDFGASPPQWGVATSPLVEAGLLLVDVGGEQGSSLVAFDKSDGKEVWRSRQDKAGYSAPIAITVGGVRQVVFFTASHLVAVAPKDGAPLWSVDWKTSWDVNAATPIFIAPDKIFVSSGYDVGAALFRIVKDEAGFSANELWKSRELKNKFSSSVYLDGYLYGFDEKTLKCVDAATGQTRWRQRGLGHGSLIYADGRLIVLGDAGRLVLAEATPEAYREQGSVQIFNRKTWTMPTLANGRLYLRDEKELLSLDLTPSPKAELDDSQGGTK